jgi:hypothetical protein
MNIENIKKLSDSVTHRVLLFTPIRNILLGAGLAYCIQQENYYHIPLVIVVPSAYVGYHAYKNRAELQNFLKEMK